MKKLHKILTLALALIMILGVMAVPASAYERKYVVWTEDEFWDLSNPRPDENTYLLIVTAGDDFDDDKVESDYETYRGHLFRYVPTCRYTGTMNSFQPVLDAAMEAYNRVTDATWKKRIADTFELDIKSDDTPAKPETPVETKPETPVTPPTTTTPPTTGATPVTGFSDVKPGDWYYEAVMALANSGIIAGYGDGRFGPNNTITAGELATIMCRIYGIDLSTPVKRSTDKNAACYTGHKGHDDTTVNAGHWAETAIMQMHVGNNTWGMCIANMELNRGWAMGELAGSFTSNVAELALKTKDDATIKATLDSIPDIASDYAIAFVGNNNYTEELSHYPTYRLEKSPDISRATTGEQIIAQNYIVERRYDGTYPADLMAWNPKSVAEAYIIGLTHGIDSNGTCAPWEPVTRAQIVQMLYNMGITQAGQLTRRDFSNSNSNIHFGVGGGSSNSK